jgi:septation ring formation regulator EzrA
MKFDVKEFKENAKKVMEEQIKNNELSFSELVAKSDALVEELTDVEKRRGELTHELIEIQGMIICMIYRE